MTASRIVILVGPGRSGTSSIAGTLTHLGLRVPTPVIKPNPTNPSGFFEPRWVVDFHKELLQKSVVRTLDASPQAYERAAAVGARPGIRRRLKEWLTTKLDEGPQLVVKDPRTIWFRDLWVETAEELGVRAGFVTMLRHPAEVSGSREQYYSAEREDADVRGDDIARIAGWLNVAITAEQITRGADRVFLRYTDLMADWRSQLARVGERLDLAYEPSLQTTPHPVDAFIDPNLRRVRIDWDDIDVPASLRDLAEDAWQRLSELATNDASGDPEAIDAIRERYARLHADAEALTRQTAWRARVDSKRKAQKVAPSNS